MPHRQEIQFSVGLQNGASNNFNWMLSLLPSEKYHKVELLQATNALTVLASHRRKRITFILGRGTSTGFYSLPPHASPAACYLLLCLRDQLELGAADLDVKFCWPWPWGKVQPHGKGLCAPGPGEDIPAEDWVA